MDQNAVVSITFIPLKVNEFILFCAIYIDVNECLTSNGGCVQSCTNNEGSFECSCRPGFALANDGLSCNGTLSLLRRI